MPWTIYWLVGAHLLTAPTMAAEVAPAATFGVGAIIDEGTGVNESFGLHWHLTQERRLGNVVFVDHPVEAGVSVTGTIDGQLRYRRRKSGAAGFFTGFPLLGLGLVLIIQANQLEGDAYAFKDATPERNMGLALTAAALPLLIGQTLRRRPNEYTWHYEARLRVYRNGEIEKYTLSDSGSLSTRRPIGQVRYRTLEGLWDQVGDAMVGGAMAVPRSDVEDLP